MNYDRMVAAESLPDGAENSCINDAGAGPFRPGSTEGTRSMENTSKSRAPISKALRYKIFERDSYTCQYCGRRPPDVVLHVDHRTPVSRGGTNEEMNLLTACSDCNGGKGARMPGDISPTPDASSRTARIAQEASEYEQYLKHSRLRDEYLKKAVQAIQGLWHQSAQGTVVPNERVIIGVWTASCPCQPFSAAGKRKGTADQRHLWPEVARLVAGVRPVVLIGEQVARRDGLAWFDDVCNDLERCDYTVGANVAPACGFGSPHIRERLYWLAIASGPGLAERGDWREPARAQCATAKRGGDPGGLEHGDGERCAQRLQRDGEPMHRCETGGDGLDAGGFGEALRVGHAAGRGCGERGRADLAGGGRYPDGPGPVNGFWAGADWVLTRPQRLGDPPSLRPIAARSQPLAHGTSGGMVPVRHPGFTLAEGEEARTLRLRGYGDGIVAPQAAAFIRAVMEVIAEEP